MSFVSKSTPPSRASVQGTGCDKQFASALAREPLTQPPVHILSAEGATPSHLSVSHRLGDQGISLELFVRKGASHAVCADTIALLCDPRFVLLGFFDGFGSSGKSVSETSARLLVQIGQEKSGEVSKKPKTMPVLFEMVERLAAIPNDGRPGGSTALIILMTPDRHVSAASIGDSPLYYLSAESVRRAMYNQGLKREARDALTQSIDSHVSQRNVTGNALCFGGCGLKTPDFDAIAEWNRQFTPLEALLGASDGLSKNLAIEVTDDSTSSLDLALARPRDWSGAAELRDWCRGRTEGIVLPIAERVIERMELDIQVKNGVIPPIDAMTHSRRGLLVLPADDDLALGSATFIG